MRIFSTIAVILLFVSCSDLATVRPVRKDITETVYASGKILSNNEYNVYALSSGTVIKKPVKEGDTVSKDEVLYIIKNDAPAARLEAAATNYKIARDNLSSSSRILNDLKLAIQSAQTKLSKDSSTYFRMKNLFAENIGTKENLDGAYMQYNLSKNQLQSAYEKYYATVNDLNMAVHNAESQLSDAKTNLDNYFIRSQSNGTVFQTYKELGESVKLNDVLALLGETSNRIIKLAVDQQDIDKIRTGQQVLVKTDITGNTVYRAKVTHVYPLMNEADQTFRVDAVFTDSMQQQFIHSSVEANIIIQKKNNALVIPRAALVANDSVRVMQDGKAKIIFVQTGISTLDETEILQGLSESSQVVLPNKK